MALFANGHGETCWDLGFGTNKAGKDWQPFHKLQTQHGILEQKVAELPDKENRTVGNWAAQKQGQRQGQGQGKRSLIARRRAAL